MDEKGNQDNEIEKKSSIKMSGIIELKPQKFKYNNEEGFIISKSLNSSNDKLIIKVEYEQAKKFIFSKEYTFDELTKECPLFAYEEKLEDIDKLISESINKYGANCSIDENDENKLNLKIKIKINFNLKEIKIKLDKADLSDEDYFSSLNEKINDLLKERRQVLGVISITDKTHQKLEDDQDNLITKLQELEKKEDKNIKIFNTFIESTSYLLSNSNIICDKEDIKLICDQLKQTDDLVKKKQKKEQKDRKSIKYDNFIFKLVYRATRDGDSSKEFHNRCDNIGPNIVFVKTENGKKFGGFTNCNWGIPKEYLDEKKPDFGIQKQDPDSFCFSLDLKKIYEHDIQKNEAIFCCNKYGPTFCSNIFAINDKMLSKGGYCTLKKGSCYKGQESNYEIAGEKRFVIKELEVYEVVSL